MQCRAHQLEVQPVEGCIDSMCLGCELERINTSESQGRLDTT